eukprot:gene4358-7714_t
MFSQNFNTNISTFLDQNMYEPTSRLSDIDFLMSSKLKISDTKSPFEPVTLENFDNSLTNINQQLSEFGFPGPVVLEANTNNIFVLETFIAMISQKRYDNEKIEELKEDVRRNELDLNNTTNNLIDLERKYNRKLSEIDLLKDNHRNELKRERIMKAKVSKERDSYALKYRDMKQKQTQYHNKYLQTEKICSSLKEKLQRALNDKGMKESGMGILNAIPKNTVKQDIMKSTIIQALEDDYDVLLKENEEMRSYLKGLNEEMEEIRTYFERKTTSNYNIHPGMFDLPFESVKDSIEDYYHCKMEAILELIEIDKENEITLDEIQERLDEESLSYFVQLQQKVEDQLVIIQEQDNLLQHCLADIQNEDDYFSDLTQSFTDNL